MGAVAVVAVCVMLCLGEAQLFNASAPTIDYTIKSCIGETITLPVITPQKCTDKKLVVIAPNGRKRGQNKIIRNAKESDSGVYQVKQNCNEEVKTTRVEVNVNCESRVAFENGSVLLQYQKSLRINDNATNVKMILLANIKYTVGSDWRLIDDGKITPKGEKEFKGRATAGEDYLLIEKLKSADSGNYTFAWLWLHGQHQFSHKFTYKLNVTAAPKREDNSTERVTSSVNATEVTSFTNVPAPKSAANNIFIVWWFVGCCLVGKKLAFD